MLHIRKTMEKLYGFVRRYDCFHEFMGIQQGILSEIAYGFRDFLQEGLQHNPLKCEYYLPSVVSRLLDSNKAEVKVLLTTEKWYGVTYREDKPMVMAAVKKLEENDFYPKQLCGKLEAAANFCLKVYIKKNFHGEMDILMILTVLHLKTNRE